MAKWVLWDTNYQLSPDEAYLGFTLTDNDAPPRPEQVLKHMEKFDADQFESAEELDFGRSGPSAYRLKLKGYEGDRVTIKAVRWEARWHPLMDAVFDLENVVEALEALEPQPDTTRIQAAIAQLSAEVDLLRFGSSR